MTSFEWTASITAIAIAIAKDRTPEEINFLALLVTQLGDTLFTLATPPPDSFGGHG